MTTLREAAQQALELLKELQGGCTDSDDGTVEAITIWVPEIIDDLRAALAEPVQEPVAWRFRETESKPWSLSDDGYYISCKRDQRYFVEALYTAPPQRKPLTEETMRECAQVMDAEPLAEGWHELIKFARAIEREHGIGGQNEP